MAYFEDLFTLLDEGWEPSEGEGFSYGENDSVKDWRVLKAEDNKIYAIANKVIGWQPFDENGNNDWKSSSLRYWLNEEFAPEAFLSDPDEETLEDTLLAMNENGDWVSLLKYNEVEEYQDVLSELSRPSTMLRMQYEEEFEDWYEEGNLAYWLLPKDVQFTYVDVYNDSGIITEADAEDDEYWQEKNDFSKPLGVRPTIIIDLNKYL